MDLNNLLTALLSEIVAKATKETLDPLVARISALEADRSARAAGSVAQAMEALNQQEWFWAKITAYIDRAVDETDLDNLANALESNGNIATLVESVVNRGSFTFNR